MKVVIDTNVLVSGILGRYRFESVPGELIRRLPNSDFELVVSDFLIEEVERTLSKPFFRARLSEAEREDEMASLRKIGQLALISEVVQGIATHFEDDLILAIGLSANADILVTGDKDLLSLKHVRGMTILSPRDFLALLDSEAEITPQS